jgi:NADH-quinone oxidoreductase subunit M
LQFKTGFPGYQFDQNIEWVREVGIHYHVGVDGINVGLVLMAAVVAFAAACCSRDVQDRQKEFYILLLVMTGGILGAFASLDLFFLLLFPRVGRWCRRSSRFGVLGTRRKEELCDLSNHALT